MEANINLRKKVVQTSPMQNILAYIKETFKFKPEEEYNDGSGARMLPFETKDLLFIVDIYLNKPSHLRVYILFDEVVSLDILNRTNAISRFAKGTLIKQRKGVRLCVEIEQMMYGVQTKSSAEDFISYTTDYIIKYMDLLAEEESKDNKEGE